MDWTELLEGMRDLWPLLAVLAVGITILATARWILLSRHRLPAGEPRFLRHAIMLALTAILIVGIVLALPIGQEAKGQLLTLLGVLLSGVIALSSTTFVGNAMAGLMLRAVRSFRPGDFLQVEGHFGRVTEVGFLHTELQTEDSELTTLPNLFLVTHPVTVTRHTGTFVHVDVSLGYDVPHWRVDELLRAAVTEAGMADPFVQVIDLGDHSVAYRVAGFQKDVKQLLSARSRLRTSVMDSLHAAGVEIVSPTYMNQRQLSEDARTIPRGRTPATDTADQSPEAVIFDKAEKAETRERMEQELIDLDERLAEMKNAPTRDDATTARLEREQERAERRRAYLEAALEQARAS